MDSSRVAARAPVMVNLKAIEATPASFAEFGQVISASPDGEEFGPNDAQLELHRGVPRHPRTFSLRGFGSATSLPYSVFCFDFTPWQTVLPRRRLLPLLPSPW